MITLNIDSRLALPNIYPPIRRIQIPAYIRLFRYRSDFRPVPVISSSLPPPHSRLLRLHRAYDLFTRKQIPETTPQISGSMFDHTPPLRALFNRPQQLFTQHTKPYIYHCFGV
ncbi:hypothetical protein Agabi119p4_1115 [Agaricus bisporus var. burnettii]|uniref:Uncharacterized protein n=1 Tax=Agaricus bisporus var. burnettii TaxID=192524 RepID=A0A8H7FBV0_AGABI|nr:hypothetical protein Agabi119p4_1115 [Agaricus bisporus var. burnettii]